MPIADFPLRRLIGFACSLVMLAATAACAQSGDSAAPSVKADPGKTLSTDATDTAVAIFAGGCFWCMEPPFDQTPGVVATTSGYIGGNVDHPSYAQVSAGGTGHAEAVRIEYNPSQVTYARLLEVFWHNVDPVALDRQFCDRGSQYRSAIFVSSAEQRTLAEESKRKLEASGRFDQPIATQIVNATTFWPAEDYHQDYYEKNPLRYKYYRYNCGRDQRLDQLWGADRKYSGH